MKIAKLTRQSLLTIMVCAMVLIAPNVYAGAKLEIDDTKWMSLGLGLRTSFLGIEDGARSGKDWRKDFQLENLRLYVNGQLHKNIKIEFNTECDECAVFQDGGTMIVLDAIGKFEFSQHLNIWGGRLLVPQHRAELDGPFYQSVYTFWRTPFYPADFGAKVGQSGRFGRDDGINFWGAFGPEKRLTYVGGVFEGVDEDNNRGDHLLWAARVSYNFLEVEQNPGYYTSSTYFGKGGDVLTLAYVIQYQEDGAGTAAFPSNFLGMGGDLLFEKVLANKGVVTIEGEGKWFNPNLSADAVSDASCFCIFDGTAWSATGLYLIPKEVGWGLFQPYVRYTKSMPTNSSDRWEIEGGTNYVIEGFNARLSLFYQYGDINSKGRVWVPTTNTLTADEVSAVGFALQLQL